MTTITVTTPVVVSASTSDNFAVFGVGDLIVNPGVTVSGFINVGDGGQAHISGTTLSSVVTSNSFESIFGTASNVVVDGSGAEEMVISGTTRGTIVVSGGVEAVAGNSFFTAVGPGGGQDVFSGGTAFNTTVFGAGNQGIGAGGLASGTIVESGGFEGVSEFGSGGTAESNTVHAGGRVVVASAGLSEFGTISGSEEVFSGGQSIEETVASGGFLVVEPGGFAEFTNVQSGGTEMVVSSLTFGDVISSGGLEELFGNTSVTTTIFGGTVELGTIGISLQSGALGSVIFDGGGRLRIDGTQMPKTVISAFSPGETINLESVTFDPKGSVTLTAADVLQVGERANL